MNLRHHCITLCGLKPESTREAQVQIFAPGENPATRPLLSGPLPKPLRIERITVTADQCHTGNHWSLFMLSDHVSRLGMGDCLVGFLPEKAA